MSNGKIFSQLGSHEHLRDKFGVASFTEGHKTDMPALQAADVVAYATYIFLTEKKIVPQYLENAFSRSFEMKTDRVVYACADAIEKYLRRINGVSHSARCTMWCFPI